MAITLDALRSGMKVTESVGQQREILAQSGQDMMQMLVGMKETEDYLHFAAALGAMRRYAGGEKLIPGSYLDNAVRPLIDKMEELDGLVAGERAGVPENVKNPFIFSELRENLGNFAHFVGVCIEEKNGLFSLGQQEIELLRALDGMNRHLGLSEHPDWAALRKAAPAMKGPVPMDERVIDDLKDHWKTKSLRAQAEAQRRAALAGAENGSAPLLLNSRQAALADDARRKSDPKAPASPESRPYLMLFSLTHEFNKYRQKYEDQMDEASAAAMKDMMGALLMTDIALAGPDSDPDQVEPDAAKAQELLTEHFWPKVVQYFGSFEPNARVPADDSRLFRMLHEVQDTLALPEATGGADMRKVYNYVAELNEQEAPWSGALDMARLGWNREKQRVLDAREEQRRIEQEKARLVSEQKKKEEEEARKAAEKKLADEEEARKAAEKKLADEEEARKAAEKKLADEAEARKAAAKKLEEKNEAARIADEKKESEQEEKVLNEETAYAEMNAMGKPSGPERELGPDGEELRFEGPMTQEEYFRQLMDDAKERVEKRTKEQQEEEKAEELAREREKKLPPPTAEGKTWGEFGKALEDYLKRNVKSGEALDPRSSNPRPQDIPHITQVTQFLVARKRFIEQGHKDEAVDPEELVRETNQLLNDPGYGQLLKSAEFRSRLAWRGVDGIWERITEASAQASRERSQASPFIQTVQEVRENRERTAEEQQKPMKNAIDNVYARLTDPRWNADIRKTGFLFFKPSDTGIFQTAVRALGVIASAQAGSVRSGDVTAAKQAVKEYLDARKDVRGHEYGKRRWEKMMCAYKALETPENFARYCEELNLHRGVEKYLQDDAYVHPSAFDAARMDLEKPQIPMNEALRLLKQDYAKEAAADKDAAKLNYFARISAMRAQATEKNIDADWGTLVDMEKLRVQGTELSRDPQFLEAYRSGDRRVMFAQAEQILHPRKPEIGGGQMQWKPDNPEPEKGKSIGSSPVKTL